MRIWDCPVTCYNPQRCGGIYMWVSTKGGTAIAGWFISGKILQKWMIWGYPYFWKPPYIHTYIYIYIHTQYIYIYTQYIYIYTIYIYIYTIYIYIQYIYIYTQYIYILSTILQGYNGISLQQHGEFSWLVLGHGLI